MEKKIMEMSRDPFSVVLAGPRLSLVVDPKTGDIFMGTPLLRASKGLIFSLIPKPSGHLLRLQYADIDIDVGWTEDAEGAASWVKAVNRFLATKRESTESNGKLRRRQPRKAQKAKAKPRVGL